MDLLDLLAPIPLDVKCTVATVLTVIVFALAHIIWDTYIAQND